MFEYLKWWRVHNLSGVPVPVFDCSNSKNNPVFFCLNKSLCSDMYFLLHVLPLRTTVPGPVSFLSHQVFIHIDSHSLNTLFFRLRSPSSFSLPFYIRCSKPLNCGDWLDLFRHIHVSLALQCPSLNPELPMDVPRAQSRLIKEFTFCTSFNWVDEHPLCSEYLCTQWQKANNIFLEEKVGKLKDKVGILSGPHMSCKYFARSSSIQLSFFTSS